MGTLAQDVRHAVRIMNRNRGFAAAALLTIALGVGVNTAVFSVLYGVLFRPLPYPEADRLVRLSERHAGATSPLRAPVLSNLTYHAWIESKQTIEGIAAYGSGRYTVTGFDEPMRLVGASVSPLLFSLLRTAPAAGRFFRTEEATEDSNEVILSDGFWRRQFGADPAAIGRTLNLDGRAHTIIGVARTGFYFPDRATQFWTPRVVPRSETGSDRSGTVAVFRAIARLKRGITPAQAAAEGTAAARGAGTRPFAADLLFGAGGPVEISARTLSEEMTASVRPALIVLAVGVGLVLLIACANVANLFLSRGLARSREIAVRHALGAGRGRLIRQLLTESLALSAAGGSAGILLAWGLMRALPAIAPPGFPRVEDVRIDGTVLAFAAAASILAGILSGVAPAFRGTKLDLSASLHAGTWTSARGFRGARASRLRGALLVAEAAFAVMLLIAAGLLVRSFEKLIRVDAGYDPANVVSARIYLSEEKASNERTQQFLDTLFDRLRRTPGVIAAGAGNMAPFASMTGITGFQLPVGEGDGKPRRAQALLYVVTPGYAEALGLRLHEGRFFSERDMGDSTQAMMVNAEFVRQYLTGGRVEGRRYPGLLAKPGTITAIVGTVGNVLKDGLDTRAQPEIYLLPGREARSLGSDFTVVVRTAGDPLAAVSLLRSLVHETDRSAAMDEIMPLEQRVSGSVSQQRFATTVLTAFAALALILAAVGLYGVLSYNVAQRRRELGVRAALGATRRDLMGLVLREGMTLTVTGLLFGIAAAAGLTRLMTTLLFGVRPLDGLVYAAAPVVLAAVAVAACLLPARRAASADPAEALRAE